MEPAVVLAVATAAGTLAAAVYQLTGLFWGDLATYRAGAEAAGLGDGHLYQAAYRGTDGIALGFTYPPFAALLLRPLAAVGMPVAIAGWTLLSVVALVAVIRLVVRETGVPRRLSTRWTVLSTVAALPVFAVSGHLQVGQVGLLLMWLVLVDLLAGRNSRWYGVGVGLAAGVKLTPLIFIGYLVLTGRWRAAATALATFAATVGVGFAWRSADSAWFWGGGLFDTARVTADPRTVLNQSLAGAVARIDDVGESGPVWLACAGVVAVAGMALAVWASRAGSELVAVLVCAGTGLLVSPVSWHHHWVWWVPTLVALAVACWRARHRGGAVALSVVWLTLVGSTGWVLASPGGWDLHFTGAGLVYSNLYVLLALAGFGVAAWLLHDGRAARRPGASP
ncbi:glycosyltransferase 87 family protein [Solwaraspora sp. WMMD406]|uniref:glycosyltransferase 87 family protein n=1 Tax=Solwaraspora sp. WMMD406 TaxID=3016095 RepID=UPI002417699B|nr:glycosyltransferase 87 family protein [Solwaraspora sp. WMMD406]MDG4766363.1 glycosyltransferase 87 family protein [Solwaraspora sp. WMMD406]